MCVADDDDMYDIYIYPDMCGSENISGAPGGATPSLRLLALSLVMLGVGAAVVV